MEYLFREIGNRRWWGVDAPTPCWVLQGELLGDALRGLRSYDGDVSTFVIDSELRQLKRVAAAFACTRQKPGYVDYVLVPLSVVENAFTLRETTGGTPDETVNELHRDIIELTPSKLADLAYLIGQYKTSMKRLSQEDIENEIRSSIRRKFIDCKKIKTGIKKIFCP